MEVWGGVIRGYGYSLSVGLKGRDCSIGFIFDDKCIVVLR